jgi:hypothetical protein
MQSSMTMELRPSGDSGSSDVDAEISDGFSPLDTSHRDVADEGTRFQWSLVSFLSHHFDSKVLIFTKML